MDQVKIFKRWPLQILLGPFSDTVIHRLLIELGNMNTFNIKQSCVKHG